MRQLSFVEFLSESCGGPPEPPQGPTTPERQQRFEQELRAWKASVRRIYALALQRATAALVLFVNQNPGSAERNRRSVVSIGPERTYHTLAEVEDGHLGTEPDCQRPIAWTETTDKSALTVRLDD